MIRCSTSSRKGGGRARREAAPRPGSHKDMAISVPSPLSHRQSTIKGDASDSDSDDSASDNSEENEEDSLKDGNVLMVDQLWLWAVDTSMSISKRSGVLAQDH